MNLMLVSPAFAIGPRIPKRHKTGEEDVSPKLKRLGIRNEMKCLGIGMGDPDATSGTFGRWQRWQARAGRTAPRKDDFANSYFEEPVFQSDTIQTANEMNRISALLWNS